MREPKEDLLCGYVKNCYKTMPDLKKNRHNSHTESERKTKKRENTKEHVVTIMYLSTSYCYKIIKKGNISNFYSPIFFSNFRKLWGGKIMFTSYFFSRKINRGYFLHQQT